MDLDKIDYVKLKRDLIDDVMKKMIYVAKMEENDLKEIEISNDDELLDIAIQDGFDLEKYIINE